MGLRAVSCTGNSCYTCRRDAHTDWIMTMQDFSTSQGALLKARAELKVALEAVSQAVEQQKAVKAGTERLIRRFDAIHPPMVAESARLETLAKQVDETLRAAQAKAQDARTAAQAAFEDFTNFTDPRQNVSLMSDRSPFLLLPVRVETRFVRVNVNDSPQHQLWVRIYPDDCSLDTFEPMLSETELANAQRYWQAMWRAGGVEADERAAWRRIVTAHGSGRASWIVDSYQPTNVAQKPVKAKATDEILVIPTQTLLTSAEATATATYWQAIWLSDDDPATQKAKQQAARAALEAATSAARAAEIIANYSPYNLTDKPQTPLRKTDVALSTTFVIFPGDPLTKQGAWTQAPRVNFLADRFVVLGYTNGVKTIEAIGGVVSLPLVVGPDPSGDATTTIHPQGGDLFVPDELQWMVDFDRAVEVGMALRIDLTDGQAASGFDRLLVLGLQLSLSDADGKTALEDLFKHHHFGHSGLSMIPQGTPTHNTTGNKTGYTRVDDPDKSFDDRKQQALFSLTGDPMRKQDGQWLAELIGINPSVLARVHNSGSSDQLRARAMQCALWPATLGYWMDKLMTPVFGDSVVENTYRFFTNFVSGCGSIPAISIGNDPYGILATTAFS
ncbi:MAG TPA: hypothetical protein VKQ72_05550, partial [Aggregatilineales bacterium]|nr:hypothetical protein [Aggregatilineales bacterium]